MKVYSNTASTLAPKIALFILVLIAPLVPQKDLFAQQRTIYLPVASTAGAVSSSGACSGLNAEERAMMAEFMNSTRQRRPSMRCNSTLSAVARARAQDMADRNYFGHINPDGIGPDYLAERAGYNLPSFYGVTRSSNHIESIAAGGSYPTASAAWNALLTSPTHRVHLLGQPPIDENGNQIPGIEDFFREQSEFGIGYAYTDNTRYRHYWVIISAHPAE